MGDAGGRRRSWGALAVALAVAGCEPHERARDAEAWSDAAETRRDEASQLEAERTIVERAIATALTDTPQRAVGVMLTDAHGPRFHVFGPRSPDGAPFDPDTTFEIGSVSKVFAGLLLADAELRGEIALDDPIEKHLPDWNLPSRDGRQMTLRHAATHFTGLPLMPSNWVKTSGGEARYTEALFRENLAAHVLESAPGERYVYGNLNTALVGLALTRRTGRVYSALLHERIFDPLAMSRSGYPDLQQRIDGNVLDGYEADDTSSVPRIDRSPMGPCCVIRSTLRDMGRFAAAALDPSGPLSGAFARAAEPQRAIDPHDPDSRWIALAWEIDPRLRLMRKSGQVAGYRCELVLWPRERRALFVLVNSMRAKILDLSEGLIGALWRRSVSNGDR